MQRDIVVIGGSAGSIEALKIVLSSMRPDVPASIFIVVHVFSESPGILAELLAQSSSVPIKSAVDGESIRRSQIYVAPPDHHLTLEAGKVRVSRGPRENRHRPAIDPLFRSAAREFGSRVIGIVLSGSLDDGSAGLYAIKQRGGIAVAQDPQDAVWSEMPRNAIAYANPQHVWRAQDISANLNQLVTEDAETVMSQKKNIAKVTKSVRANRSRKLPEPQKLGKPEENFEVAYPDEGEGTPSVFACPECHGVLWELKEKDKIRFRCRVGHAYGAESLAKELSSASENALWAAVRALEEKSAMQRRLAERIGQGQQTARMLEQSAADTAHARLIRDMIFRSDAELEDDGREEKAS